jgi:hypothetical protein
MPKVPYTIKVMKYITTGGAHTPQHTKYMNQLTQADSQQASREDHWAVYSRDRQALDGKLLSCED